MIEELGLAGLSSLQVTPRRKKKSVSKSRERQCRCFPAGEDMTEPDLYLWCVRNMHSKMCSDCERFPDNGPVVSDYQRDKRSGIVCKKCDKHAGPGASGVPRLCLKCENEKTRNIC